MPRPGVVPSRQRGRDRVAAILDAAAGVFAARGFDGATMTEIAASSGTAIGSLYRFFPNKERLADALFLRYADAITHRISALMPMVSSLAPAELARHMLRLINDRDPDRELAMALAETSPNGAAARTHLRAVFRAGIAEILQAAGHPRPRAEAMAPVVALLIKGLADLAREGLDGLTIAAELRIPLTAYLTTGPPERAARDDQGVERDERPVPAGTRRR